MNRQFVIGGLLIVALAGILSFKCYREVTVADRTMEKANKLLKAKEFAEARAEYQAALVAGGNRLVCLGSIVECDFGLKNDAQLIIDADLLKREQDGKGRAYYFLGIMHRRQKNYEAASFELQRSDREGFPLAVVALGNLRRGG